MICFTLAHQSERYRPRRGAMVSCENLLTDSSELFGALPESTLKNLKNSSKKIYRSGGIFSNPFKNDAEKMEQLNELLKQYKENGIPNVRSCGNMAANYLRASSLSMGGPSTPLSSPSQPINIYPLQHSLSIHASTRTSLSSTDLQYLQQSSCPASESHGPQQSLSFDATSDSTNYYLEPEWRSIVDNFDQLSPREQSLNEAIWEILQTEVFYIRRLKVINDVFISCLLNLQSECLLNEVSVAVYFSHIFL